MLDKVRGMIKATPFKGFAGCAQALSDYDLRPGLPQQSAHDKMEFHGLGRVRVRRGQKRLLRRLGSERDGTRAVGCIAAETSHGLHELRG